MKKVIYILLFLLPNLGFGQEWRDSLTVARDAYKAKNYGKALKYYKSAQKNAPEGIDLSEEIAQSAYRDHQYEMAEEIYKQTAQTKKSEKQKAADYHNLGNAQMRKKDYQGAVESYKESLRKNPNDAETRYNLSEAMRQLQNQQQQKDKNQDQQDQQDQQNQQDQQDQQDQQNKQNQQNQQSQNQQNGKDGKPKNQKGQKGGNPKNSGKGEAKLQDKAVEKKLDELMKQEADTKRKLSGRSDEGGSTKSGKDW